MGQKCHTMTLTKILVLVSAMVIVATGACKANIANKVITKKELANKILADASLLNVEYMAAMLLRTGFNAGDGYHQVWIRDLNTFIETSCVVYDTKESRKHLLTFFNLQQKNGEIVDCFIPREYFDGHDPNSYSSASDTRHIGFKNTAATDQETSLIQAVGKYIKATGDKSILDVNVDGKSVTDRMSAAIEFLLKNRYSQKYGLITGATTLDWGDVQPEDSPGIRANENTHWSCDIYDNAMFIIALNTMIEISNGPDEKNQWIKLKDGIARNTREYLWDSRHTKFIPHVYLKDSPFPSDFDENAIYFHGGTAVAIEAGLLSKEEIQVTYRHMVNNVKQSGAPSIGLTIYPPYPQGYFKNVQTSAPYTYQNGGDWTWFGGRMIQQLIANGFVHEAYDAVRPMIDRVMINRGFHEWYDNTRFDISLRRGLTWYGMSGKPHGSGEFRGSAGVLSKVVHQLREWAIQESPMPDQQVQSACQTEGLMAAASR